MDFWKASVYRALHRWSGMTTISIGGALEGFDRALQSPPEFFLRVYAIEKSLFFWVSGLSYLAWSVFSKE
jgi:hypothetical protein